MSGCTTCGAIRASSCSERIEQAGYRIEKLTYTNAALFPVAVLARLADRLRGLRPPHRDRRCRRAGQRGDEGDVFGRKPDRAERARCRSACRCWPCSARMKPRRRRRPPGRLTAMRANGAAPYRRPVGRCALSRFAVIGMASTVLYAVCAFGFCPQMGASPRPTLRFSPSRWPRSFPMPAINT